MPLKWKSVHNYYICSNLHFYVISIEINDIKSGMTRVWIKMDHGANIATAVITIKA